MRRQLIELVTASMSLLLIAFVVPLLVLLYRDVEHRAEQAAVSRAYAVAPVADIATPGSLPSEPEQGLAVTVFKANGQIIGVPAIRTPAVDQTTTCRPSTSNTAEGVEVLVPVPAQGGRGCPTVVRVLASNAELRADWLPMVLLIISLSAALLLTGVLLAERLGRGLLRSVTDLAGTADRLAAGDMLARVTPNGPAEIRKAGTQLNRLAIRVDQLLDTERRRGADLTHRLRTPLTALRLDIDALPNTTTKGRLIDDVAALGRAVDQVIVASRSAAPDVSVERTELTDVVRDRVAFWSVLAEDTARNISVQLDPAPLLVPADRNAVGAALDALLGNVFAHTPDGAALVVTAYAADGSSAVLTVDDAGPGFSDLGLVARGRSGAASTGLGLDIAKQTAEDAGGFMRLGRSSHGGARVELHFGPVAPAE